MLLFWLPTIALVWAAVLLYHEIARISKRKLYPRPFEGPNQEPFSQLPHLSLCPFSFISFNFKEFYMYIICFSYRFHISESNVSRECFVCDLINQPFSRSLNPLPQYLKLSNSLFASSADDNHSSKSNKEQRQAHWLGSQTQTLLIHTMQTKEF